jgi:glutamine synthetase adenylyltransferase
MTFNLLLADEDAKINLNTIYRWQSAEEIIRLVQDKSGFKGSLDIRLRPYRSSGELDNYPAFDSWGQVFVLDQSTKKASVANILETATGDLTCWGSGKLNLEHSSDEALERIGLLAVSPSTVKQLIENRHKYLQNKSEEEQNKTVLAKDGSGEHNPSAKKLSAAKTAPATAPVAGEESRRWLSEIIKSLALRQSEREQLEQLLTDHSSCYSLWITVSSQERDWHSFYIADTANAANAQSWGFVW